MKQSRNLDQILQQALSPEKEPDYRLNQNILRKVKENEKMDKKQKRRVPAVVMGAAFTLLIGSVTAVAAWQYMTPDKVAEVMEDEGLMRAFQSKDAIVINESQICGDLKITLLGIVSGKDLSSCVSINTNLETDGTTKIKEEKTYIVTAIENVNDTADTNVLEQENFNMNLTVSPFIKGLKPWQFNIYTMGGGCTTISENGIEYRITESDNIEIFADRGLYLSVTDGAPSAEAYVYDESIGEITRNESYQGVNVLFDLPIDKSKADREAAEKYLKEMEEENAIKDTTTKEDMDTSALIEKVSQWTSTDIEKNAELQEDLTQVLTPDTDGRVTISAFEFENGMGVEEGQCNIGGFLQDHSVGEMFPIGSVAGDEEVVYIETLTLNEDGTVTYKIYRYSEAE